MFQPNDVYTIHITRLTQFSNRAQQITRLSPQELLVLSAYPLTVTLGQLVNITSWSVSALIEPNYYTSKHNLVNVLFVKQGWFWTLVVLTYYIVQHRSNVRNVWRTISRITLATLWWIVFTQWFFGLPIMDRIFVLSGGACQLDYNDSMPPGKFVGGVIDDVVTGSNNGSLACRKQKGHWIGGHDSSGHVFLLVHGSLLVWFEVLELGFVAEVVALSSRLKRCRNLKEIGLVLIGDSVVAVLIVLGIWWWMLLITSIHFHTISEKISGLLFGLVGLLIYVTPRVLNL